MVRLNLTLIRAVASPGVAAVWLAPRTTSTVEAPGCSAAHAPRLPGPGQALANAEAHLHQFVAPAAAGVSLGMCREHACKRQQLAQLMHARGLGLG